MTFWIVSLIFNTKSEPNLKLKHFTDTLTKYSPDNNSNISRSCLLMLCLILWKCWQLVNCLLGGGGSAWTYILAVYLYLLYIVRNVIFFCSRKNSYAHGVSQYRPKMKNNSYHLTFFFSFYLNQTNHRNVFYLEIFNKFSFCHLLNISPKHCFTQRAMNGYVCINKS